WFPVAARARSSLLRVLYAAVLSAAIALLHPFHLPVLLLAMFLTGALAASTSVLTPSRTAIRAPGPRNASTRFTAARALCANQAIPPAALLAALPILLPTVLTFALDPFWSATYGLQNKLPSPAPHELFVDLGWTLVLALLAVLILRGRAAPSGLLLWLMVAVV